RRLRVRGDDFLEAIRRHLLDRSRQVVSAERRRAESPSCNERQSAVLRRLRLQLLGHCRNRYAALPLLVVVEAASTRVAGARRRRTRRQSGAPGQSRSGGQSAIPADRLARTRRRLRMVSGGVDQSLPPVGGAYVAGTDCFDQRLI